MRASGRHHERISTVVTSDRADAHSLYEHTGRTKRCTSVAGDSPADRYSLLRCGECREREKCEHDGYN